ncbi:Uu.00g011070.m01.CDS01 [Anthostomella pinea]|uniref:Uu.00g011070.m01.CDS01 n=1 Tax=Anthostomella pinea TaxID=933095 RepID=A0AAI8VYX9_9PEZI|nr:Uu.00g011070.m01.CDS01 [Anthostomella pinea]
MDLAKEHSTATTIGGYAFLTLIVGALYLSTKKKAKTPTVKQITKHLDVGTDTKKKSEKAAKPKKPKAPSGTSDETTSTSTSLNYNQQEDDAAEKKADREFARQLANTHAGHKFNTKTSDSKRTKSVKQSKAQETTPDAGPEKSSVTSSTTGDADDDLSPQTSPIVSSADGRDVSDMLEATTPGPSILRLTDTDSVKKQKERKAKAPEPVESKKQRQNRKKAEAAKAAREEDEKERKVKMEQQRRAARVAEGRAAKDGSGFMASTQNAWNDKSTNGKSTNGSDAVQPLDTFERQPKPEAEPEPEPVQASTPTPAAAKEPASDTWSGMPSEEEQMELLRQEDSWNEVKTKKKGKKKDGSADNTASAAPANGGDNATPSASIKSRPAVNGAKKPILTSSSSSFAALTPEETDDNDEVEKEWDV